MSDLIRSRFLEKEICLTDNDILNPSPLYNWNIVESGVKQHQTNMLNPFFVIYFDSYFVIFFVIYFVIYFDSYFVIYFDSYFASLHKTRKLLDFIKECTEINVRY